MAEGALIGALIGAVIGGIIGAVMYSSQKSAQKKFNLHKGMTVEDAFALLGEPQQKTQSKYGLTCIWYIEKDGKKQKVSAVFRNNIMI